MIVVAMILVVVLGLILQPWWEGFTIKGLNLTVTNDTHHAITWKCGTGDRVMQPGATDVLRFAIQPEDTSGCDYANGVEMCLNEFKPYPSGHVTASYAISQWACK
ncbi:hypothetical protein ASF88_03555 [Leifsonia sp. Leaf336]|nr:hypothetical protein ASF88_03555 [Leifsonia sp. Leaf336]